MLNPIMPTTETTPPPPASGLSPKFRRWFKRMGLAAFLFFFLKGLAWLAVFYFGADFLFGWLGR